MSTPGMDTKAELSKTPEQRALNNYLDLGVIVLRAAQTLDETKKLLAQTERIVAPEGKGLLVTPPTGIGRLIVEKFKPPTAEQRQGSYSQHFTEPREEIAGVRIMDNQEFFMGRYIEYDADTNGYYIYYQTGESRSLHRAGGNTSVQMVNQDWADSYYLSQS